MKSLVEAEPVEQPRRAFGEHGATRQPPGVEVEHPDVGRAVLDVGSTGVRDVEPTLVG